MSGVVAAVRNLRVSFAGLPPAVDGVSLEFRAGEFHALVGESGGGKTLTALALLGLLPASANATGEITLAGATGAVGDEVFFAPRRGRAAGMVFQEPLAAFNPLYSIGDQLAEAIAAHAPGDPAARMRELFDAVAIPEPARIARAYPHQLSGGMLQRAMLAVALAGEPQLLVADEPTTALDLSLQQGAMELIAGLCRSRGLAVLFITHNLGLAHDYAETMTVMYLGTVVERGPAAEVLQAPAHPYTRALLDALPRIATAPGTAMRTVPGDLTRPAQGCVFAPRCPLADDACRAATPAWRGNAERGCACLRPLTVLP